MSEQTITKHCNISCSKGRCEVFQEQARKRLKFRGRMGGTPRSRSEKSSKRK